METTRHLKIIIFAVVLLVAAPAWSSPFTITVDQPGSVSTEDNLGSFTRTDTFNFTLNESIKGVLYARLTPRRSSVFLGPMNVQTASLVIRKNGNLLSGENGLVQTRTSTSLSEWALPFGIVAPCQGCTNEGAGKDGISDLGQLNRRDD